MISMFRRIFVGILLIYLGSSYADDIPPPPYQLGNGQFIFIGVEWDEQTIKDFLPKELKPVAGMTGGINIYYTKTSDPINWEAGYYWIDVEGFDAPDGTKGRFILAGHTALPPQWQISLRNPCFNHKSGFSSPQNRW